MGVMSTNAAVSSGTNTALPAESVARLAAMPDLPGIQLPRIAPKSLALVIALHVAVIVVLANHRTEVREPQRPVMVSLIPPEPAPEAPKPEITPPKPLPATPKPVKKKAEPKPEKKPEPVVQPEPQLISKAPENTPAPSVEPPAPTPPAPAPEVTPPPQPEVAKAAPPAPEEEPPIDPPLFNADYLDNPAPGYPPLSRRLHEEGRVLLRVHVAAGGTAMSVALHKSSGHSRLDQIALDTVKKWKFVPARQGDKPVDAWVIVPIQFSLKG
jgi:protein TonB